jgi:hypothetical protein
LARPRKWAERTLRLGELRLASTAHTSTAVLA